MRSRELFVSERQPVDTVDWPEPVFDVDDESFAQAIAAGRNERHAA